MGRGEARNDNNTVTGTFPLNQRYAHVLFDSGADKSFISSKFAEFLESTPTPMHETYSVEIATGKTVEAKTIIQDCDLDLLGHKFSIDVMPMSMGSFDVVVGMQVLIISR